MKELALQRATFAKHEITRLREALLASPLVARSTLAGSFRQTRGFAVTFTLKGVQVLVHRFPEIEAFVAHVISDERALASLGERLRHRAPHATPNAFYLNLLLVQGGGAVGRHTDATLRGPSGVDTAVPVRVSVLYLAVPPAMRGGELRLFRDASQVARVKPREGLFVHFRGELQHEVSTVELADPTALRASLVCEQYAFDDVALARLPPFAVQSRAGFGGYLDDHARRGIASFDLE